MVVAAKKYRSANGLVRSQNVDQTDGPGQSAPLWGAPRIHGELQNLGLEVSERTVSRLMPRRREAPSQIWRTFLDNHPGAVIAIDFFTVPTASSQPLKSAGCIVTNEPHDVGDPFSSGVISIKSMDRLPARLEIDVRRCRSYAPST
jgi:hypothetical protein